MTTARHVLAMDSGGSKTLCHLARMDGTVLASTKCAGMGGVGNSPATVRAALGTAIGGVLAAGQVSPDSITAAYVCLGGLDTELVERLLREKLSTDRVLVKRESSGDVLFTCAPLWGFDIAIMAGTGTVALGAGRDGTRRVVGGWGALIHDRGSGYAIGQAALCALAERLDYRGGETTLLPAFARLAVFGNLLPEADGLRTAPANMSYEQRLRIKDGIKNALPDLTRQEVAGLARTVMKCADEGDCAACAVVNEAGRDLANLVCALVDELELGGEAPVILKMGGLFKEDGTLNHAFEQAVRTHCSDASTVRNDFTLAAGAVVRALQMADTDTGSETIARLRNSLR
ncbi:MAG: hypothetical protein KAI66_11225 [Lentisphaeria bacterium]|nr:hypothetical protein [Lentisphaeria bacterium]